jgi:hypothetical protein
MDSTQISSKPPLDFFALELPRQTKAVHFRKNVDVREVPSLKSLPADEIEATWYTAEDFQVIKKTLVATVRMMIAEKPLDKDLCSRGLECRTPIGAKERKSNKLAALKAVWNEQVAQWKADVFDPEAIRAASHEQTTQCCELARQLGEFDEQEARGYTMDDDVVGLGNKCYTSEVDEPTRVRRPRRASPTVVPTAA